MNKDWLQSNKFNRFTENIYLFSLNLSSLFTEFFIVFFITIVSKILLHCGIQNQTYEYKYTYDFIQNAHINHKIGVIKSLRAKKIFIILLGNLHENSVSNKGRLQHCTIFSFTNSFIFIS